MHAHCTLHTKNRYESSVVTVQFNFCDCNLPFTVFAFNLYDVRSVKCCCCSFLLISFLFNALPAQCEWFVLFEFCHGQKRWKQKLSTAIKNWMQWTQTAGSDSIRQSPFSKDTRTHTGKSNDNADFNFTSSVLFIQSKAEHTTTKIDFKLPWNIFGSPFFETVDRW